MRVRIRQILLAVSPHELRCDFDPVDRRLVGFQHCQPLVGDVAVAIEKSLRHADRVHQLQPKALCLVECRKDVIPERFKIRGRVSAFGKAGRYREDQWFDAEQTSCVLANEPENVVQFLVRLEQVDLVQDEDDLFAPALDLFEERPLRLTERLVG
ncbi:MAG: hypothetical protein R2849_09015 [Thermomicrobiales bacterium]